MLAVHSTQSIRVATLQDPAAPDKIQRAAQKIWKKMGEKPGTLGTLRVDTTSENRFYAPVYGDQYCNAGFELKGRRLRYTGILCS